MESASNRALVVTATERSRLFRLAYRLCWDPHDAEDVNGVWSYGWRATLAGAITLYPSGGHTENFLSTGAHGWFQPGFLNTTPLTLVNVGATAITFPWSSVLQPNTMLVHAGPPAFPGWPGGGQANYSVVRWTALVVTIATT